MRVLIRLGWDGQFLKHNRFANFEEALLESIGVAGASAFMDTHQPWSGRAQDTDFGVEEGREVATTQDVDY